MKFTQEQLKAALASGRRTIHVSTCYICGGEHINQDKFCSEECHKAFLNKSIDRAALIRARIAREEQEAKEAERKRKEQEKKGEKK